jgi:pyruvate/2-oxoglutarate dehydrogenase complex dihydrolipoamide acyltransferase (E2) component
MQIHGWNWTGVKSRVVDVLVVIALVAWMLLLATAAFAQNPAVIIPGPIPTLTANCTIQRNGANNDWTCAAAAGASQPLTDSSGLIANSVDATKILAFQLSGLTTGTTRTWTIPDANITIPSTIASLGANTFTGLQTANAGLAATTGTFSSTLAVTGAFSVAGGTAVTSSTNIAQKNANETVTGAWTFSDDFKTTGLLNVSDSSTMRLSGSSVSGFGGLIDLRGHTHATLPSSMTLTAVGASGVTVTAPVTSLSGLLTVSGFGTHSFNAGGTGDQELFIRNTTSGVAARSGIRIGNNDNTAIGQLLGYSSTYTTSGAEVASGVMLRSLGAGGLSLTAADASGDVRIYSRNALAATFGASQLANFTGGIETTSYIAVTSGQRIYPDGGGDTYIVEQSSNTLRVVAGGSGGVDLTSGATSWAAVSDQRLKADLTPITSAAWKLGQIRALTGRYAADASDVRRSFLIAQDVRAVLPEAVSTLADGMFTLRYTDVIPLLVGGVNEIESRLAVVEKQLGISVTTKAATEGIKLTEARTRVDRVAAAETARVQREASEAAALKAKQDAAKAQADKLAAAQAARQAIRTRLAACDADNAIIVVQGGKAETCEKSDADRAERKAMQTEAAAAKAKADAADAEQRKQELARCVALNAKIKTQGGTPVACTTGEVR